MPKACNCHFITVHAVYTKLNYSHGKYTVYVTWSVRDLRQSFLDLRSCSWLVSVSAPRHLVPWLSSTLVSRKHKRITVTTAEHWLIEGFINRTNVCCWLCCTGLCVHGSNALNTFKRPCDSSPIQCIPKCKYIKIYILYCMYTSDLLSL